MENNQSHQWRKLGQFVEICSPWLTLIGEKLQDDQQRVLDYWRVEKADSLIIVTIQNGEFILPKPMYRPGVQETTLDFPGGRISPGQTLTVSALEIIEKELGITKQGISSLNPINREGWAINSSFSNQKLYGFVAEISVNICLSDEYLGVTYPVTPTGVKNLLQHLTCLQCRALLLEWWQNYKEFRI